MVDLGFSLVGFIMTNATCAAFVLLFSNISLAFLLHFANKDAEFGRKEFLGWNLDVLLRPQS